MSLATLRDEVVSTMFDSSTDTDEVDALINEGLLATAEIILLPKCEASAVIDTVVGENRSALPTNYHRNLFRAKGPDGADLDVYATIALLEDHYEVADSNGIISNDVCAVTVVGSTGDAILTADELYDLFYTPSPVSIVSVPVRYYRKPIPLIEDKQEPFEIPAPYRSKILANYARWRLFDNVEDGIDGAKANTRRYENLFKEAVATLEGSLTQGQSRPRPRRKRKPWF